MSEQKVGEQQLGVTQEQPERALYRQLLQVLGEPPKAEDYTRLSDFVKEGVAYNSSHSPESFIILSSPLGLAEEYMDPYSPFPREVVGRVRVTAKRPLLHKPGQGQPAYIVVEGNIEQEMPVQGSDEKKKRVVTRSFALGPSGQTAINDRWTEKTSGPGYQTNAVFAKRVDQPPPPNFWQNVHRAVVSPVRIPSR